MQITVNQKPISISVICPHCCTEWQIPYQEFIAQYGDPCDWDYIEFQCPDCGAHTHQNDVDWD